MLVVKTGIEVLRQKSKVKSLGSSSGSGLGLILGAGGSGEAGEGGEDRPPRPDNWKKMTKSQQNHWKRQGGKARKGGKFG